MNPAWHRVTENGAKSKGCAPTPGDGVWVNGHSIAIDGVVREYPDLDPPELLARAARMARYAASDRG